MLLCSRNSTSCNRRLTAHNPLLQVVAPAYDSRTSTCCTRQIYESRRGVHERICSGYFSPHFAIIWQSLGEPRRTNQTRALTSHRQTASIRSEKYPKKFPIEILSEKTATPSRSQPAPTPSYWGECCLFVNFHRVTPRSRLHRDALPRSAMHCRV